jgi:hypothetical protein
MRAIFLSAIIVLLATAAQAGDANSPAAAPQTATQPQATRIESNQKTGAVEIIVNGREVARFDAKGLHVRDAIDYGGEIAGSSAIYSGQPAKVEPKH